MAHCTSPREETYHIVPIAVSTRADDYDIIFSKFVFAITSNGLA